MEPGKEQHPTGRVAQPYYHKVDPEGNQLPYIDRCVSYMIQDVEVLTLKTMNGEIDYVNDKYVLAKTKPTYIDGQKKGNYRLFDVIPTYPNAFNIALNLNAQTRTCARSSTTRISASACRTPSIARK